MGARMDEGRLTFTPNPRALELQRIIAGAIPPPPKPKPVLPPPVPRFDPARCQATVLRVRALRALGLPHTVIEDMTGIPQRTSSDICTGAHGGPAVPTDADLLEAGASLARWVIEKRGAHADPARES